VRSYTHRRQEGKVSARSAGRNIPRETPRDRAGKQGVQGPSICHEDDATLMSEHGPVRAKIRGDLWECGRFDQKKGGIDRHTERIRDRGGDGFG